MTDIVRDSSGVTRSIDEVKALAVIPPLWCAGVDQAQQPCNRRMQAKALHSSLVSPHFAGTHIRGCNRGSHRSEDRPGDAGHAHAVAAGTSGWVITLDDAPTSGPDGRRRPDDSVDGTATRRSVAVRGATEGTGTLRRHLASVLAAAIAGNLPQRIALPGARLRPTSEAVASSVEAHDDRFGDGEFVVWGTVAAVRTTGTGATMLLLGDRRPRFGVLIAPEIRWRFALARDDEFVGRHVVAIGTRRGEAGRPYMPVRDVGRVAFEGAVQVRPDH